MSSEKHLLNKRVFQNCGCVNYSFAFLVKNGENMLLFFFWFESPRVGGSIPTMEVLLSKIKNPHVPLRGWASSLHSSDVWKAMNVFWFQYGGRCIKSRSPRFNHQQTKLQLCSPVFRHARYLFSPRLSGDVFVSTHLCGKNQNAESLHYLQ